eukprot:16431928-Heterocapsa_arctica.AAC.1
MGTDGNLNRDVAGLAGGGPLGEPSGPPFPVRLPSLGEPSGRERGLRRGGALLADAGSRSVALRRSPDISAWLVPALGRGDACLAGRPPAGRLEDPLALLLPGPGLDDLERCWAWLALPPPGAPRVFRLRIAERLLAAGAAMPRRCTTATSIRAALVTARASPRQGW